MLHFLGTSSLPVLGPLAVSLLGLRSALASDFASCRLLSTMSFSPLSQYTTMLAAKDLEENCWVNVNRSLKWWYHFLCNWTLLHFCPLCILVEKFRWGYGAGIQGKRARGAARLLLASASPPDRASAGLRPGRRAARRGQTAAAARAAAAAAADRGRPVAAGSLCE